MGRLFVVNLEGKIYSCKHCRTHLALYEDIFSKTFHCRHGKAYLFNKVVNVSLGEKEDRPMMTGLHTVADIFCVGCGSIVGWKYLLVTQMVLFRRLPMKKPRSTRKENLCLNGTRCQVLMEAIIGSTMKHMLAEVMLMMLSRPAIPNSPLLDEESLSSACPMSYVLCLCQVNGMYCNKRSLKTMYCYNQNFSWLILC